MNLTCTIRSHVKPGVIYGNAGENVQLITADHGDILIVEGENGTFPVHRDKVTESGEIKAVSEPEFVVQKVAKKKGKTIVQTNQLF